MGRFGEALTLIIKVLMDANVAIPIIATSVGAIYSVLKSVTGGSSDLNEVADLIEAQVDANDAFGKAEVARLRR